MKRFFALMLVIIMVFSSVSVGGTALESADTVINISFPVSYANKTATITVLKEGYDIDDVTEVNKAEIVVSQVTETVPSTGEICHTFNFDNLNQDYMFVATAGDIVMKQIINPYQTPKMQFNKIWLAVDGGTVTVSGRMSTKSPDGVTVKLMNSSASGPDDTQNIAHIMMAYIDSFGNISDKTREKKEYTFETDESGDCTLYISYGGVEIYKRTINPSSVAQDVAKPEILDIDFGLMETYEPLSGTTKEKFETAVAELPEEIKVIEPIEIAGDYEIYVSPDGDDTNDGSYISPLKTIKKALQMRNIYNSCYPNDGVVIYLRGGEYEISGTLNISDTGERVPGKPLIISSYNDEEVVLTNAETINVKAFKKIKDQAVLNRLPFDARNEVLVADFADLGLYSTSILKKTVPTDVNIYSGSNKLNIARWPNADNVYVGEIVNPGYITDAKTEEEKQEQIDNNGGEEPDIQFVINHGYKFPGTNERPLTWADPYNAWVTGHLSSDFNLETLRIKDISYNEEKGANVLTVDGYNSYGANATPLDENGVATNNYINYYYFNILEELDSPGEFYIDKENEKMYYYPDKPILQSDLKILKKSTPVIKLTDATNVVINGIKIRHASGNGIYISNGYQNLVQNVEISNATDIAFVNEGGERNGIIHSTLTNNVGRAAVFRGNYPKTFDLTPSRNFIQNCICYSSPIEAINSSLVITEEVGAIASHNLVMNSGSSPIGFGGNGFECIIEYNEVVGGPTNTVDAAGIYLAGHQSYRGNHIRYNYIHDLSKINDSRALTGIYFDWTSSGNYAYGNVIKGVPSGLYSHNGHENVFFNNLIIGDGSNKGSYIRDELNALSPSQVVDNVITQRGVNELWAYQNYYKPSTTNGNTGYIFKYLDQSTAWQQRYPSMVTMGNHLKIIMDEFEAEGLDKDNHYVTDREIYLRRPYDAYYANNLAVTLPSGESESAMVSRIAGQHIRLVGKSTNRTYVGDPGFADASNDNFALKDDAVAFTIMPETLDVSTEVYYDENLSSTGETYEQKVTVPAFVAPPFEKMGLTNDVDLDKMIDFTPIEAITPNRYFDPATTNNLVSLKWTDTGVSNYYKVSIADNPDFSDALSVYAIIPMCQFDLSETDISLDAPVYYWKVEAFGKTKSYGDVYETASTFSFARSYSDIEITDFTITPDVFSKQQTLTANATVTNHMGSQVTPLILFASYDKNDKFISYTPVNDFTIDANQTEKSVGPVDIQNSEANISYVKLMIWSDLTNSLKIYGKHGVVYSK